jgi:hypothetical protein
LYIQATAATTERDVAVSIESKLLRRFKAEAGADECFETLDKDAA